MAHIHTEPGQIDHTVTGFIIRVDTAEPELLLHLHKKYGVLLPPGGHIELDETPWAAMAHEIQEEAGYEFDQLQVMQPELRISSLIGAVTHPQPFRVSTHEAATDHYHSDLAYLFIAHDEPKHAPAKGESTDIRWVNRTELAALTAEQMYPDAQQSAVQAFDHFLREWQPVPAASFSISKIAES
ncbi:hypothetical protein BH09PAT4_BH09PAT4_00850 [soil metagenome]